MRIEKRDGLTIVPGMHIEKKPYPIEYPEKGKNKILAQIKILVVALKNVSECNYRKQRLKPPDFLPPPSPLLVGTIEVT